MPSPEVPNKVLAASRYCEHRYDIGHTKMAELIRTGAVQSVKVGRARRIVIASLERYLGLSESGEAA